MKIKEYFFKLKKDELIRGSFILFVMIGFFNLFNYFFQISMAKLLGPADYSILAVLMSFLYIFGIPTEAIQTIITKYTSKFSNKKDDGKIKDLLYRSLKKGGIISLILFIAFIPFAFMFSNLLEINFWLIILSGVFIFYSLTIPVVRGVLQGRKKFPALGWNLVLESTIKFIAGILLVIIGLNVWGAVGAFIIGSLFASFFIIFPIKDILKSKQKRVEYINIFSYNLPVLIGITSIVLIYSIDVILARRFFSPEIAGQYAFVSLIGKTILFSSLAIGKAMFPIVSENFEKKIETRFVFKKAIMITSAIALIALLLFFAFPEEIIKILSLGDTRYLSVSNILFFSGLSFSFASISYILILYNISINKMKKSAWGLLIFVLLEVLTLSFFNESIFIFSISLMLINLLMLAYNLWITKF